MSRLFKDPASSPVTSRFASGHLNTFHAVSTDEVLTVVNSNAKGLTHTDAMSRLAATGANVFSEIPAKTIWIRLWEQLKSPLALILVLSCAVTLGLSEFVDAAVIAVALLVALVVGVLQEGKASRAFRALAHSQIHTATVMRDGARHEVPAAEVVVGDIILLQAGQYVPADARVLTATECEVNEAVLTGESQPVHKNESAVEPQRSLAEQSSMVFRGTNVTSGQVRAVVVATGDATEMGKIAASVQQVESVETPLQGEMRSLSQKLMVVIVVLVVAIFVLGVVVGQPLRDMLIMAIAIAVASVPEGLPAAVTIVLAVGMETLLRRGGLVRNLLAAETLGSTTYVLTDKTGTLTVGTMHVAGLMIDPGTMLPTSTLPGTAASQEVFNIALAATDAYTDVGETESVVRGDAVERAILSTAAAVGITEGAANYRSARIDYVPFTSERRYAAGLVTKDDIHLLCVNGAPATLLSQARSVRTSDGVVVLDDATRELINEHIARLTQEGKRLVAIGYKETPVERIGTEAEVLGDLTLAGILVFSDPVRSGVAEAITGVKAAGARVLLVTGDNPHTALAIAQTVGIAGMDEVVLTGADIAEFSDEALLERVKTVSVFARVLPNQKLRIATLLQKHGEIVAMTGDGVNDAPALQRANIGVAIGSGTEVAKEAADLVLVDDSFATIYAAIEEGRRIVENLRKIVAYLISTSLTEVVVIAAALLTGAATPLLPAQILWANMIEEGLMSVAFAFEPSSKRAMQKRPHDVHEEGLISRSMAYFMLSVVTLASVMTLSLYGLVRFLELPLDMVRSVMFVAIAVDSLFIAFAFRSLSIPVWRTPLFKNRFFILSVVSGVGLLILALTVPFLQYVLSYTPLPWPLLVLPIVSSVVTLLGIELAKWFFFERRG